MKHLLIAAVAALVPVNVHAQMCTGIVVNSPVRTLSYGLSSHFKVGEKTYFITQRREVNGTFYFCSWSGICANSGDIRLHRVMAIKGDPSRMNGVEIKKNAYETLEVCTPNYLLLPSL